MKRKKRRRRTLPKINVADIAVCGEDDIRAKLPETLLPDLWRDLKGELRGLGTSIIFRHERIMNEIVRLGTAASCPCCDEKFSSHGVRLALIFSPELTLDLLRSEAAVSAVSAAVTFQEMHRFCAATWAAVGGGGCTEIWDCDHFCGKKITHEMNDFVCGIAPRGEVTVVPRDTGRVGFLCQKRAGKSTMNAEDTLVKRVPLNFDSVHLGRGRYEKRKEACR